MIVSHWLKSIRCYVASAVSGGFQRPAVHNRRRSSWQGSRSSCSRVRLVEQLEDRTLLTPQVSVSVVGTASEDGPTTSQFVFVRSDSSNPANETNGNLTVYFSISGTASSSDYVSFPSNVTIPNGFKSATVTLTPIQDSISGEGTETVILTLIDGVAYDIPPTPVAVANILDATVPTVTISASDPNAAEVGSNSGAFTVTMSQTRSTNTTISYNVSGTATNGVDYTSLSGSVVIPAGSKTATITVAPTADSATEGNETVVITLVDGSLYDIIAGSSSGTVTIADTPTPTVSISASDPSAAELGPDSGTFTITMSQTRATSTTITYTVSGSAITGVDYTSITGSVVIPAGSKTATVNVTPISDLATEGNETVIVTLVDDSVYDLVAGSSSATVTIADTPPPTASISAVDGYAAEIGPDTGMFTITLSRALTTNTTITYTVSGTATNGVDYTSLATSVVIGAGWTFANIYVVPNPDALNSEGYENVVLTLVDGSDYDIVAGTNTATVRITDAPMPIVNITANDASASEVGPNNGQFVIGLNTAPTSNLTVNYTISGTASNTIDYTPLSGSVTIPAGQTYATVTITPVQDSLFAEGSETVILTLSNSAQYEVNTNSKSATVTIADAPAPVISITAADPNASEVGPDGGVFTIGLSTGWNSPITLNYSIGGTATNGTDYTQLTGTLVIPANVIGIPFYVTPIQDALTPEGSETVVITLIDTSYYDVSPTSNTATVTIADAVPTIGITASDSNASEVGSNSGTFTFTLSSPLSTAIAISVSVAGTATSGTDYSGLSQSVIIPAGVMSTTVTFTPTVDNLVEGSETVVVSLTSSSLYNIDSNKSSATATIADAGMGIPVVSIIATDASASEYGDTGAFTISLAAAVATNTTISLSIGGTATSGTDYTGVTTSVTIPAGQTSTTLTVSPILDNLMTEGTESVVVSLASSAAYQINSKASSATVNIGDVPLPFVTITATDNNASETGPDGGAFTINLANSSPFDTTIGLNYSGSATSVTDYSAMPSSVTIPAGSKSTTISFMPVQDSVALEGNEIVTVTIAASQSYEIGPQNGSASATITDSPLPVISIAASDASASEVGPDNGVFTISLSSATSSSLVVNYTIGGTATNTTDYTALSGSVTIPAGQTSTTITVTPVQDSVASEGNETVVVSLSASSKYLVHSTNKSGTVTIADAPLPTVSITASDASASEVGPDTGSFTISLSAASSSSIVVNYTLGGTAANTTDYTGLSGAVTIPAGQTSTTITVTPVQDAMGSEGNETVIASISTSSKYQISPTNGSATVTIADAPLPTVSITASDASASEVGPNTGAFTISLSAASSSSLVVNYTLGGTATNTTDYIGLSGTVTIPAGQTSTTITVTPVQDAVGSEGNETVIASISSSSKYQISPSNGSATVTIADAPLPIVSINAADPNASEVGPDNGSLTISLNAAAAFPVTVNYTLGGTATNKLDYSELTGSVTIPAGQTSTSISIIPVQDVVRSEGSETVIATLSTSSNYQVNSSYKAATVTIADAPLPVVSITISDPDASELGPDAGYFTVALNAVQTSDVLVQYSIGGTASNLLDYEELTGTVSIPAGQTSATIMINPMQDEVGAEGPETVVLSIVGSSEYAINSNSSSASVTIADSAVPIVSMTATDPNASEVGPDSGTFTISLSFALSADLTVNYTVDGTATNTSDYNQLGGSVTIPAGATSATITVTPVQDPIGLEGDETVAISISTSPHYELDTYNYSATATIADAPLPIATITVSDANASEVGPDVGSFTISLSAASPWNISVSYSIGGTAANSSDYSTLSGSVTIPAGQTSASVTITPVRDPVGTEGDETVVLSLSSTNKYEVDANNSSATVTIADAPLPMISISANDDNASEVGPDPGSFVISLDAVLPYDLTVYYSRTGTATQLVDYSGLGGTAVTITSGQLSKSMMFMPYSDGQTEGVETVILALTSVSNYEVDSSKSSATARIADSGLPTVWVNTNISAASEVGPLPGLFSIVRSGPTTSSLKVFYSVSGSATQGVDYGALTGVVTIPVGLTFAWVAVSPVTDLFIEGTESVVMTITNSPQNTYTIDSNRSSGTVEIADLPLVSISTSGANASELEPESGEFTISLGVPATTDITIDLSVSGTADSNSDFLAVPTSVTIPAGQTSTTLTVAPVQDGLNTEGSETVTVSLLSNIQYGIVTGNNSATVTILDDSTPVAITPVSSRSNDEHDTVSLTLNATGPAGSVWTYSASPLPTGLSIDPATGVISGTIAYGAAAQGTYTVQLSVTNQVGIGAVQALTWTVNGLPPAIDTVFDSTYSVLEDDPQTRTIDFHVDDRDTPAFNLAVTATIAPVSLATLSVVIPPGGAAGDRQLRIVPSPDQFGTGTVTITVTDADGLTTSKTLQLEVAAVNDEPSFTKGADITVDEDAGPQTIANWATNLSVGPANENGQTLAFEVIGVVDDQASGLPLTTLFSVLPSVSAMGTLKFQPKQNMFGTALLRVRVKDNGGIVNDGRDASTYSDFKIVVTPVNDPPTAVTQANLTNFEGDSVDIQLTATDVEDAANQLTYSLLLEGGDLTGLPPGLTLDANGRIHGRIHYSAATPSGAVYGVDVKVTDSAGGNAYITFDWTAKDAAIESVLATEIHDTTPLPNTITATALAAWETIYVSPENKVELTLAAPADAVLPGLIDIFYRVTPSSGAAQTTGSFGGFKPKLDPPVLGGSELVEVGFDENQNGTMESSEYKLSFTITTINLAGALITSARTAGGPIETAFTIQNGEHFDIGSTFEFAIDPGAGTIPGSANPGMVRWELGYAYLGTDGEQLWHNVSSGAGVDTRYSFTIPTGGVAEGSPFFYGFRYYIDSNGDGIRQELEQSLQSNSFVVVEREVYNLKIDVSTTIGLTNPQAAVEALIQQVENLLLKKDSLFDFRAAVALNVQYVNTITPDGVTLVDPATLPQTKAFADLTSDIVFIDTILPYTFPDGTTNQYVGYNWDSDYHSIVCRWSTNQAELGSIVAHELGHGVGLSHAGTDIGDLMRDTIGGTRIREFEATAFENGAD